MRAQVDSRICPALQILARLSKGITDVFCNVGGSISNRYTAGQFVGFLRLFTDHGVELIDGFLCGGLGLADLIRDSLLQAEQIGNLAGKRAGAW
ncbi:hypothetical protein C6P64_02230 [Malikia granosa]|uniref:Uncharacterized protein n=1 Tax=Malikia granosa TaxID=263067 RepID=A0A2S9K956_9BURK|nr:hypothetical protein C6P64_02230 [Malikia granosa]